MAAALSCTVIEHCRVAPPPATAVDKDSLPLTFFGIMFVPAHHTQRLIFYQFPISKSHFLDSLIPKLKNSLSLALKHFYPLAGNLLLPTDSTRPEIRYVVGDSVSLTFSESTGDFDNLTANHARSAEEFYHLVPRLPEATKTADSLVVPLLALQVTLFPGVGLCVGITNHHAVADASAIFNFIKAWALITKFEGVASVLTDVSLPLYDRNLIKDPQGLLEIFYGQMKGILSEDAFAALPTSKNKVRATFIFERTLIQRLKHLITSRRPTSLHVSTFTVVCAIVWSCTVRSRAATAADANNMVQPDEVNYFGCAADCRARLDPPLPENYFGNCLTFCMARATSKELSAEDGFMVAAELIGDAIRERLYSGEVLKGVDRWISDVASVDLSGVIGVAGSPRYNYYDVDFGWGKATKFEFISIDYNRSISLSGCRKSEGDIEVGLTLLKPQMDAFTRMFSDDLKAIFRSS